MAPNNSIALFLIYYIFPTLKCLYYHYQCIKSWQLQKILGTHELCIVLVLIIGTFERTSYNCELNLESNYQKTFPGRFCHSVKQAVRYQCGSSPFLQIQSGFCAFKVSWSHQKYIKHWIKIAKTFKLFPVIVRFPFWTCIVTRIDIYAWGKELLTVNKEAKIFPHQQQSELCEAFCIIFHHTTINKYTKKWIQF